MEPANWESWWRVPELRVRESRGVGGTPGGMPEWRRSGDESSWEKLTSNVEVLARHRRPQSCIEGSTIAGLDGWLENLERIKCGPVYPKSPTFTGQVKSVPAVPKEQAGQVRRRHSDLFVLPGTWNDATKPAEQRQTVHFRSLPEGQPIKPCGLVAVKSGWLPVQRRAILCNLPRRPNMLEENSSQAPFHSDISGIMPENVQTKNGIGCTDRGPAEMGSQRGDTMSQRLRRFPSQAPLRLDQERSESLTSVGSHLKADQRGQLRERERILPDGPVRSGCGELSRGSVLRRTTSAPEGPSFTAPPAGCNTGPPKLRTGFSSITIASRKVPQATNILFPVPANKSNRPEHSTPTSAAPVDTPVLGPAVVYRRKATAIKVTGRRQSYSAGETLDGPHPAALRHSFAEGDSKENSLLQLTPNLSGSQPQVSARTYDSSKAPAEDTCSPVRLTKSEEPGGGIQKIHRSTLCLYLSSPSSGAVPGDRPRRPLSFTGGLGQSNESIYKAAEVEPRRRSLGPAGGTNSNVLDGAAAANLSTSTIQGDATGPAAEKAKHRGPLNLWSPLRTPHPAFIRAREKGGPQSPDVTLALNAASVIAHIKRLSQLKKTSVILSAKDSKASSDSGAAALEDAGKARADEGSVGRCSAEGMRRQTTGPADSGFTGPGSCDIQLDNPLKTLTLQEALMRHRPDFIRRSRGRLQELERHVRERWAERKLDPTGSPGGGHSRPIPLSDNLSAPGDRGAASKEMVLESRRSYKGLADVKRRKEDDERRAATQVNRMRVDVFKKKLLDRILKRKGE